ncbi:MAG: hypothetical protein ABI905_12490 [Betaproteobacteria bacterium]
MNSPFIDSVIRLRKFAAAAFVPMLPGWVGMAWYAAKGDAQGASDMVTIVSYVMFLLVALPLLTWLARRNDARMSSHVACGALIGFLFLPLVMLVLGPAALLQADFWLDAMPGVALATLSGALVTSAYWLVAVSNVSKDPQLFA